MDDRVGFQAGTGPVHGGDSLGVLVHAQVHEPVFMVAVEVADELPRIGEAPAAAGGTPRALFVNDCYLFRTAKSALEKSRVSPVLGCSTRSRIT